MSKLETNTIDNVSGSTTLTIGDSNASTISIPKNITLGASGTTITVPAGATITNNGTQTGFGGDNTPAFSAYFTSSQSIPTATWTKINFGNELFDTDNCFDSTTNMRFTPTVAGKYLLHGHVNYDGSNGGSYILCAIYKNGSQIFSNSYGSNNPCTLANSSNSAQFSIIVDANGSTDYFEVYGQHNSGSTRSVFVGNFYGSKIIT
jgi:hypothetical protein